MDEFLILLQAKLEEASLKGIKGNLDQLKKIFRIINKTCNRSTGTLWFISKD